MSDVEKVRLLIGDPAGASQHFENGDIEAFLDMASNDVFMAAAYALKSWAAVIAGVADSEKIGDYSYSNKAVANKLAVAENYLKMSQETPAMGWAEFNFTGVEST